MTEARDVWGERRGLRGPLPPDVGEEFIEGVARMGGHPGQQVAQVSAITNLFLQRLHYRRRKGNSEDGVYRTGTKIERVA